MPGSKPKDQKAQTGATAMTGAFIGASPESMKAWMDLMNDSARFLADRLQKDQETQKAILGCKTPAELMQVQSDFFKDAVEQYTVQTSRLLEKMSEAASVTLKESTRGLSRGYDDVPL